MREFEHTEKPRRLCSPIPSLTNNRSLFDHAPHELEEQLQTKWIQRPSKIVKQSKRSKYGIGEVLADELEVAGQRLCRRRLQRNRRALSFWGKLLHGYRLCLLTYKTGSSWNQTRYAFSALRLWALQKREGKWRLLFPICVWRF